MKKIIFTLAEARSGTLYLRNIFRLNARDCDCRHETFFDFGNPTMFGPAIYDAYAGRLVKIRERLEKKRAFIQNLPHAAYFESSHSFLKSTWLSALDFFPALHLVHLVRNPLKVAASAAYRELWRRRFNAPFHFYKGDDGKRHFAWALTGNEEIFQHFAPGQLTLFQWYLVQWIEIENRAMNFLNQNSLHGRCFTLHSPSDLNDAGRLREMFEFLGMETKEPRIILGGRKNQSFGYSAKDSDRFEDEFQFVLERLPERCLEIFQARPYCDFPWSPLFKIPRKRGVKLSQTAENCSLPAHFSQLTC